MGIELRDYQQGLVDKVRSAFADGHQRIMAVAPTGCHGIDTEIVMSDGSLKRVQDIEVGDQLMGPDSTPRTVLSLHHGRDMMYEITPKKGPPFVVNAGHILNLKRTNDGWHKSGKTFNISVREYLETSKTYKHIHKLWRTGVEFENNPEFSIEPYFLGVLLGDGCLKHAMVTTPDPEIVEECHRQAEIFGLRVRCDPMEGNKASNYHIVNASKGSVRNPLKDALRSLGLFDTKAESKFVPSQYKTASREHRLQMLAGLLDTDGHAWNGGYEFSSKSLRLAMDVVFLARSLGFMSWGTVKPVNGTDYYRVSISGDCSVIPCRVAHKQAIERKQIKDPLVTGFSVREIGEGQFFGFELNGDHLYLTSDFVVHHNSGKTIMFSYIAESAAAMGNRTFILVHRKELLRQTSKSLTLNGIRHDIIGAGYPELNLPIQVCSVQTLVRRLNRYKPPELLVLDESHHATAQQWRDVLDWASEANVLGVTATPIRTDGRGFDHIFSELVLGPDVATLVAENWLCQPVLYAPKIQEIDLSGVHTLAGEYNKAELTMAMDKAVITGSAVRFYKENFPHMPAAVVFCTSVAHAQHVAEEFRAAGVPAESIDGSMDDWQREAIIKRMESGETRCLMSCSLVDEGFDLPKIEVVIDLSPTKSLAKFIQRIGRGLRIFPGKLLTVYIDHVENWRRHFDATLAIFGVDPSALQWTLQGRRKRDKVDVDALTMCTECFMTFPTGTACPGCGTDNRGTGGGVGREIEEVDGEIVKIDLAAMKPLRGKKPTLVRKLERA